MNDDEDSYPCDDPQPYDRNLMNAMSARSELPSAPQVRFKGGTETAADWQALAQVHKQRSQRFQRSAGIEKKLADRAEIISNGMYTSEAKMTEAAHHIVNAYMLQVQEYLAWRERRKTSPDEQEPYSESDLLDKLDRAKARLNVILGKEPTTWEEKTGNET